MKTLRMKLLNSLFFLSLFAYSQVATGLVEVPLDKQKIEDQINDKIVKAMGVLIDKNQYILDIDIDTKVIKKKKAVKKAKKQAPYKLTDSKDPQKDYILFHKLGLEAPINPVVEEAKDEAPKEIDRTPSSYEELQSVKITVLLDELLKKEVTDNVEKVLRQLNFNLPTKPVMQFSRIKFKEKKVIPPKKEKTIQDFSLTELLDLGAKYSTSIGFILAALFLSFVAFVLFIMYSSLQKKQTAAVIESNKEIAAMASEASEDSSADDEPMEEAQAVTAEGVAGVQGVAGSEEAPLASSVARFQNYFTNNTAEASSLLKKWINLNTPGSKEALVLMSQELDSDLLLKTFETLSLQDRKLWRNAISTSSSSIDLRAGARFIDEQILEDIIVPTDLISEETKQLLYSLDIETCTKLIQENPDLGPLLMNTLSTSFIVKIIPRLDNELIETLTMGSIGIDEEKLKQQDSELQEKIQSYLKADSSSPFSDKIMEILPHLDLENEEFFFKAFGKSADANKMKEALKSFLPAKAIFDLPENSMKVVLSKMKQNAIIEFLMVADESVSARVLGVIAPEGSKKREVFDLEIDNMKTDELKLARLKKNKAKVESTFVAFARKVISKSTQVQEEIEPLIEELSAQYVQEEQSGEQAA